MPSRWASIVIFVGVAAPLSAQAATVREAGVEAVATAAQPAVYTAGVTASLRPAQRARIALYAGGGVSDGAGVGRAELVAHFLLSPRSTRVGVYGGGGIAGVFGSGDADGYLVLLVGIESAPGGRGGWFVEGGIGGGARLAAGYRWRKLPAGWKPRG